MATTLKKPINILMAEDDDDDYVIFMVALEETLIAFKMGRANDGDVLMQMLQEHIPDILFLDLQMPCKDGHECLKEIRENSRYDSLPIIVYSAMDDVATIDKCYRARSNFYAVKAGSINELRSVLEQTMKIDWKTSVPYPTKGNFVLKGIKVG